MLVCNVRSHFSSDGSSSVLRHLEDGMVDQHVDPAESLHRLGHDGAAMGQVPQLSRHQHRLAARPLQPDALSPAHPCAPARLEVACANSIG